MADQATFEEVARVNNVSDGTDIVLSTVSRGGEIVGMTVNYYLHTAKYNGFGKSAIFIPNAKIAEFVAIFDAFRI